MSETETMNTNTLKLNGKVKSGLKEQMDKNKKELAKKKVAVDKKVKDMATDEIIKNLKEEIISLKINQREEENKKDNLLSLSLMRDEISMADEFIRTILKDNMLNYMENINEEELETIVKADEEKPVVKDYMGNHMYECNCSGCNFMKIVNKSTNSGIKSKNHSSKGMLISRNVNFEVSYPSRDFSYVNNMTENNMKKIVLRHKKYNDMDISLMFTMKKTKNHEEKDYNFSIHRTISLMIMDQWVKVSLSSIIVVMSMRAMKENLTVDMIPVIDNKEDLSSTCFLNFISNYISINTEGRVINKISDLTEYEESYLLSSMNSDYAYIYVEENRNFSLKNHISMNEFSNSIKVKTYMLFTPMMRNVRFFADEASLKDFESDLDFVDDFTVKNKETKNSNIDLSKINISEKKNSTSEEEEETFVRNKPLVMSPSLSNDYKGISFVKGKYLGYLATDFIKTRFRDMFSNKGMSKEELTILEKSLLADIYLDCPNIDISYIKLMNMSMKEFKAIAYMVANLKEFTTIVMERPMIIFKQLLNTLPKMFYEKFKDEFHLNYSNFILCYSNFLASTENLKDFKHILVEKLFFHYKTNVFGYIYYMIEARDADMKNYERYNEQNFQSLKKDLQELEEDDPLTILYKAKLKNTYVYPVKRENMNDITRFQPSNDTSEFFKSLDSIKTYNTISFRNNMKKEEELVTVLADKINNM